MKTVACQVREQTKGNQRTWEHSCLRETVTLMPGETQAAAMAREMSRARTAQFAAQQAQLMKLQPELRVLSQESEPKPEAGCPSRSDFIQVDAQFALKMPSPALTPPRETSPERVVATLCRTNAAELLVIRWERSRGNAQSWCFEVYPVVDRDSGPTILGTHELHRAILLSNNCRGPATLNLTCAMVDGLLRTTLDPETGRPYSKHCHKDSRRVELWLDKEQLSKSGGDDWTKPILWTLRDGVVTVFCIG
eukprot:COSAG01_NODE_19463_length_1008_cov_1.267327_1_plen_249_part_01